MELVTNFLRPLVVLVSKTQGPSRSGNISRYVKGITEQIGSLTGLKATKYILESTLSHLQVH
jgi:hypothetical protein